MSFYKLIRKPAEGKAVRGLLSLCTSSGDVPICSTLENADYLIPALCYRVSVTQSPKFRRLMPLLCQVPGRAGIRIHRGTLPEHSRGCILVSNRNIEQSITSALLREQSAHDEIRLEIVGNCR